LELTKEIQFLFANMTGMKAVPIESLPPESRAWAVRTDRDYGVCIQVAEGLQVNEKFAGARLWTGKFQIDGKEMNMLLLTSDKEHLRMEFAVVCSQFVDPGEDGSNRRLLETDPLAWWDRWRNLLGNKNQEKSVHGLLGELMAYLLLLKRGESPAWTGAGGGSVDFVTYARDYEIKSTISRYESSVRIAGQFQLNRSTDRPLSLVLFRFEPSTDGWCINDAVRELTVCGIDRHAIESELADLGFEEGASVRNRRFRLHEIRHYVVDENFPGITLNSFKDGKLPDRVKHITYTVDLTGIDYEVWNI